jgi:hypothetical protein
MGSWRGPKPGGDIKFRELPFLTIDSGDHRNALLNGRQGWASHGDINDSALPCDFQFSSTQHGSDEWKIERFQSRGSCSRIIS